MFACLPVFGDTHHIWLSYQHVFFSLHFPVHSKITAISCGLSICILSRSRCKNEMTWLNLSSRYFGVFLSSWIGYPWKLIFFFNILWQCSSDYSVENAVDAVGHELGESQHFAVCPSKLNHFGLLPVYCLPCEVRTLHSPPRDPASSVHQHGF